MRNILKEYGAMKSNSKWFNIVKREKILYSRKNEIRDEFERDYTRIINTTAYRRMKHKTQVFFSPKNDHICTRIEHVMLVESISHTIANYLGLNVDLTKAIAVAHDIGHSPFGHKGEKILSEISNKEINKSFWHERNGLEIVDKIELLEDMHKNEQNLNLTYAVRDGIISHCGEIDENGLRPREECINLDEYKKTNQFSPYTWEGCVVKIADKISYLGRDIDDAITIGILDKSKLKELHEILDIPKEETINNTVIVNDLIYDLCKNSSFDAGLCFSDKMFHRINEIKKFNYQNIYYSERMLPGNEYFEIVLKCIYNILKATYYDKSKIKKMYPDLVYDFEMWISSYLKGERDSKFQNEAIFDISNEKDYYQAIIYYISGMTDNYAIETYNKIIRF